MNNMKGKKRLIPNAVYSLDLSEKKGSYSLSTHIKVYRKRVLGKDTAQKGRQSKGGEPIKDLNGKTRRLYNEVQPAVKNSHAQPSKGQNSCQKNYSSS